MRVGQRVCESERVRVQRVRGCMEGITCIACSELSYIYALLIEFIRSKQKHIDEDDSIKDLMCHIHIEDHVHMSFT